MVLKERDVEKGLHRQRGGRVLENLTGSNGDEKGDSGERKAGRRPSQLGALWRTRNLVYYSLAYYSLAQHIVVQLTLSERFTALWPPSLILQLFKH